MPWQVVDRGDGSESVWVDEDPVAAFTSQITGTAPVGTSNEVQRDVVSTGASPAPAAARDVSNFSVIGAGPNAPAGSLAQKLYARPFELVNSKLAYEGKYTSGDPEIDNYLKDYHQYMLNREAARPLADRAADFERTQRFAYPTEREFRESFLEQFGPELYYNYFQERTPAEPGTFGPLRAAGWTPPPPPPPTPAPFDALNKSLGLPTGAEFDRQYASQRGLGEANNTAYEAWRQSQNLPSIKPPTVTAQPPASREGVSGGISNLPTIESLYKKYQADIAAGVPSNIAAQPLIEYLRRRGG